MFGMPQLALMDDYAVEITNFLVFSVTMIGLRNSEVKINSLMALTIQSL